MISIALAAVAINAGQEAKIVEVIDPSSQVVVVQAFIKPPFELDARYTANWLVLGNILLEGTKSLTPNQLKAFGSQAGVPPSVAVFSDFMVVQFVAPIGGLSLLGDLVSDVLTNAMLRDDDVLATTRRLESASGNALVSSMLGIDYELSEVRADRIRDLYTRSFRPENIVIVVGGAVTEGEGVEEFTMRFARNKYPRIGRPPRLGRGVGPLAGVDGNISTFLLTGQTIRPDATAAVRTLLALYALGVGKESAAFQALREERGWSYSQGAVLWPTAVGWSPRIYMQREAEEDEVHFIADMRTALLEAIDEWDEPVVARAVAMVEASFSYAMPTTPLRLRPDRVVSWSLEDRCSWRGYTEMTGAGQVDLDLILGAMRNLDLDDLKLAAKLLIEGANGAVYPGR
ncbi:MAG: insulinase family protein [Armatimonadetes bacterium]|nr:insulinase family protein [Armatimonadota bacterium]